MILDIEHFSQHVHVYCLFLIFDFSQILNRQQCQLGVRILKQCKLPTLKHIKTWKRVFFRKQ
jgi:hypothetical protein